MSDSIFSTSIVKSSSLMSQKTGLRLFLTIACVVDAKVNGVVMTSPVKSNACKINSNAICPFDINVMSGTSKYSFSCFSNLWCFSPIFVNQCVSHIELISSMYSSNEGSNDLVTFTLSILYPYLLIFKFLYLYSLFFCLMSFKLLDPKFRIYIRCAIISVVYPNSAIYHLNSITLYKFICFPY